MTEATDSAFGVDPAHLPADGRVPLFRTTDPLFVVDRDTGDLVRALGPGVLTWPDGTTSRCHGLTVTMHGVPVPDDCVALDIRTGLVTVTMPVREGQVTADEMAELLIRMDAFPLVALAPPIKKRQKAQWKRDPRTRYGGAR